MIVTLLLAFFSIVIVLIFSKASSGIAVASLKRNATTAFQNADAGTRYVLTRVRADLQSNSLQLQGAEQTVGYSSPPGYAFDPVTKLTRRADNQTYEFTVTSRVSGAHTAIEVAFRAKAVLGYGFFADSAADLKANGAVYSYLSEETSSPSPLSSHGFANTAVNGTIITRMGTSIDGDLVLGASSSGTPATWTQTGATTISGTAGLTADHIEPDPLGISSGALATGFASVQSANNNASISLPTSGGAISSSRTLTAGDYYLTGISLPSGETISVDTSGGPVNIYLEGDADFGYGSAINLNGNPPELTVYVKGNRTIRFFNDASFKGILYAPHSSVEIKNDGNFYGVLWAGSADVKNSGNVFIDMNALHAITTNQLVLVSWKEIHR